MKQMKQDLVSRSRHAQSYVSRDEVMAACGKAIEKGELAVAIQLYQTAFGGSDVDALAALGINQTDVVQLAVIDGERQ